MSCIQALSSETIRVQSKQQDTEISYQDEVIFLEDYGMFEEGTILTVDPEYDGEKYLLKVWSQEHSMKYLGEELICDIVESDFAEIRHMDR